jgi:hypothetical protein
MMARTTGRGRVFLALLSVGLIALSAGCSSSSGKSATPTLQGTPAQAPAPTAFPEPTVDADSVNAPLKGFSAKVPTGWHYRPNFVNDGQARFPTDAFFGPNVVENVQPSVSMTCYAPADGKTLENYRDEWSQFIGQFSAKDVRVDESTVAGLRAFVFTYTQTLNEQTADPTPVATAVGVAKQDYVLIQGDCRWLIAAIMPPSQIDADGPVIASFISALKFSTRLT